ncbi:dehydrogenase, partial [Candidatus Bathyarchaeota archaeon]
MNKMKAVVYRGPEKLAVEEVDVPEISSQEVLVKVKAAGVCGTDVRIYHGRFRVPVKSGRII